VLDPCDDSITSLRARYRTGEVSVREVTARHLDRIEAFDGALDAVVTLNPHALREAAELDASRSGPGPLHGVPVVVKDNIGTAGIATAFGSAVFGDHVPDADATLVTALRRADAIILGKTATPDFAASWHGHSSRSGRTRNLYAVARDPGGSSSGSAAAVAALRRRRCRHGQRRIDPGPRVLLRRRGHPAHRRRGQPPRDPRPGAGSGHARTAGPLRHRRGRPARRHDRLGPA
jgi:hypothetical protein